MHDKLNILLNQTKLDKKLFVFFNDGHLNKIVGNKEKTNYHFYIELKKTLPIDVYTQFLDGLKKAFNNYKIKVSFNVEQKEKDYIKDYYQYLINTKLKENPLLEIFLDNITSISDNEFTVEVANKAEKMKLQSIESEIIDLLNAVGYDDIKMTIVIDDTKNIEIREEIAKDKTVEIPVVKKEIIEIMGSYIPKVTHQLSDLSIEEDNVSVEAYIFGIDIFESNKNNFKIFTLKLTDFNDSIYAKVFVKEQSDFEFYKKHIKADKWYKFRGYTKFDKYSNEIVLNIRDINCSDKKIERPIDTASEKRVELHTHTMMSQMDGVVDATKLVKQAYEWGHRAIAVTDHNSVQAFPDLYHTVCDLNKGKDEKDKFKVLYGAEFTLVDDSINIVVRENDTNLLDNTYVVFDFETTGFNAGGGDTIIEIGAVKICNGEIIDRFNELINPGRKLPVKITEITNITDEMLADKDNEENAIKRFISWFDNLPMVAHNAKFDISFLEMCYQKYNLGEFKNTVIDTLELSRVLDSNYSRHNLTALVKRYDVPWDEDAHHRADYDAEGTALVFHKMMQKLSSQNIDKVSQLNKMIDKSEIHKFGRTYHVNVLVKNKIGLKNLFKLISFANTKYLYKTPRILRSVLNELREGLLLGSGCYESEVFIEAKSKSDEELSNIISFYDYVEVQPLEVYNHLLQTGDFQSVGELMEHIRKIVRVTKDSGKLIVATGDVHHLYKEDKIFREIIVNQKVPGGGRHPLSRNNITEIPSQHLRTTDEMLENFDFLDEVTKKERVVTNTNKIADMIEIVEVIIETGGVPFSPKIDKSVETVTELVYDKAKDWYGDPLPYNIEERIAKELYGDGILDSIKKDLTRNNVKNITEESFKILHETILKGFDAVKDKIKQELKITEPELADEDLEKKLKKTLGGIIGGGFDVIYLIAQKLVKKSNDDGYLVGSRGSVGSSFVATMMGITEVNPLPAHYRCPECKHSVFERDGIPLANTYSSGFDLPDYDCPKCKTKMIKDGNDMPFATFLGFNADKVPDIDLNFSDLNQAAAHEYTKVLFGEDNVYRAGTIGTVADKTAFGFVKGYCEDKGIIKKTAEVERLAMGCTGVKRTTGQHPGGIVVIPGYMDVFDFTPFQYPADDPTSPWRTTHFDYHAIDQDVLKLDILGHSDPTQLRLIQDLSGHDVTKVPLDDKETMGIFLSPQPLGVTKEQILNETGTLGIPEFGTPFTIGLVAETKPTTFAELIKISGLSHGTDVWLGNAQELIKKNIVPFKEVIGCRDDIMVYLMQKGMKPLTAFKIMEFVRKGKASKELDKWSEFEKEMKDIGIEDWYIDSCRKIKYMFPKAHATAYVISAFRIAYYKVHYPAYFYASWFSTKATDFDIETMIKGYDAIKARVLELNNKGYEASNKEAGILECLKLALEMTARGLKFTSIDLQKSEATTFTLDEDGNLIPPFNAIDGLGVTVARAIVEERERCPFLSIEDLQKRAKISSTLIEKMRNMNILENLDESSQLSLF